MLKEIITKYLSDLTSDLVVDRFALSPCKVVAPIPGQILFYLLKSIFADKNSFLCQKSFLGHKTFYSLTRHWTGRRFQETQTWGQYRTYWFEMLKFQIFQYCYQFFLWFFLKFFLILWYWWSLTLKIHLSSLPETQSSAPEFEYKKKENERRDFPTQLVSLLAGAGFLRSTVCCPLVTTWLVTLGMV